MVMMMKSKSSKIMERVDLNIAEFLIVDNSHCTINADGCGGYPHPSVCVVIVFKDFHVVLL